jgi:hypothetical protein
MPPAASAAFVPAFAPPRNILPALWDFPPPAKPITVRAAMSISMPE